MVKTKKQVIVQDQFSKGEQVKVIRKVVLTGSQRATLIEAKEKGHTGYMSYEVRTTLLRLGLIQSVTGVDEKKRKKAWSILCGAWYKAGRTKLPPDIQAVKKLMNKLEDGYQAWEDAKLGGYGLTDEAKKFLAKGEVTVTIK